MKTPISRGFASALIGVVITIFSWFSPWYWPGFPALTALRFLSGFSEFSFNARAVIFFGLIVLNVGVWALIAYGVILMATRILRPRSS
jgi:hypothetical protein